MNAFVLFLCIIYGFFGMILISKAEFFAMKLIKLREKMDKNFNDRDDEFLKKYFISMKFVGYAVLAMSIGIIVCFLFFNILIV